jgi:non-reducing end alpha-L-arabinofuranosidase
VADEDSSKAGRAHPAVSGQKWVQQANGSLLNPQSGLCLDDPSGNTADGTQLQIWTCNGTPAQQFPLS